MRNLTRIKKHHREHGFRGAKITAHLDVLYVINDRIKNTRNPDAKKLLRSIKKELTQEIFEESYGN